MEWVLILHSVEKSKAEREREREERKKEEMETKKMTTSYARALAPHSLDTRKVMGLPSSF